MKAEDYNTERREIAGIGVNVTSYRIGDAYHCHVESVDPGATIARAHGSSAEQVEQDAISKAENRLGKR